MVFLGALLSTIAGPLMKVAVPWAKNKVVQALEDSSILLKGVTETIKNEKKNKKENF